MSLTYRQAADRAVEKLTSASVMDSREARANIDLAIQTLKGWSRIDMVMKEDDGISGFMAGKLESVVGRLLKHEPLQYILGEAYFYGLKLKVDENVLIPRPETAELVDMIVSDCEGRRDLHVLDVCTGSGCIATALARNLLFANVVAIDISAGAIDVARCNAADLKANISVIQADALNLMPEKAPKYDILVSNPPYIVESERKDMDRNVLDYEPSMALFVPDSDPLRFYRAISRYGATALHGGGRLYFEINPLFSNDLADDLRGQEVWQDITLTRDIHGKNRFITAKRAVD